MRGIRRRSRPELDEDLRVDAMKSNAETAVVVLARVLEIDSLSISTDVLAALEYDVKEMSLKLGQYQFLTESDSGKIAHELRNAVCSINTQIADLSGIPPTDYNLTDYANRLLTLVGDLEKFADGLKNACRIADMLDTQTQTVLQHLIVNVVYLPRANTDWLKCVPPNASPVAAALIIETNAKLTKIAILLAGYGETLKKTAFPQCVVSDPTS